jgi:hypothetical protein
MNYPSTPSLPPQLPEHLKSQSRESGNKPSQPIRVNENPNSPTAPVDDDGFPFIKHENIDLDMRKELWKAIPKSSDWEKFSGELPYNHEMWLKIIEVFVEDYYLLDHMIVSSLTGLFTDTARNWYLGIRDQHHKKSWAWWKNAIRNKFGTHNWKWKMQQEFEKD